MSHDKGFGSHWNPSALFSGLPRLSRRPASLLLCGITGAILLLAYGQWLPTDKPSSAYPSSLFDHARSYFGSYVSCPDPNNPVLPVDLEIDQSSTPFDCRLAPSNNTDFTIELCKVVNACNKFSVRIQRTNITECERMEALEVPASTPERLEVLRYARGPDSFLLRTNGAQRHGSEVSRYEGECSYRFDVTLSNGGPVWVELWWRYTEYQHSNELQRGWPFDNFQPIMTTPLRLDICPKTCPMRYAPRIRDPETWLFKEPTMMKDPATLPECDTRGPSTGIWLPRHTMDTVDPPVEIMHEREGHTPLMGRYEFVPHGCSWKHGATLFGDHSRCTTKPFKVLCYGDSHGRYTMLNLLYWLDGNQGYYPENDHGRYGGGEFRHWEHGQLELDFWQDPHCHNVVNLNDTFMAQYDAVFVSTGAWAAMDGDKDADWFSDRVSLVMKTFNEAVARERPGHDQKRLYLTPAPFPPHLSGPTRERGDHRTNSQLYTWSRVARDLAQQYEWRIIDLFERGMPVMLEMSGADGMHLSPGAAQTSITAEVFGKLEMCYGPPAEKIAPLEEDLI